MKIWAKIIKDEHILKDMMYERVGKFDAKEFHSYLNDICYYFDIPTPVIIPMYINNFAEFNHHKFRPSDFLEYVDFDELEIENC